MSILVTGAGGFIGSALCKKLVSEGHQVVGLVHKAFPSDLVSLLETHNNFWLVIGDIRWDLSSIIKDRKVETIFHLAAQVPYTTESPEKDLAKNNAIGTANLVNVAYQSGVKEFIYTSSMSVYSTPPIHLPVEENHPTEPSDLYGKTKLIGELACAKLADRMNIKILRYAGVYGKGCEKDRVIAKFVRAALSGQPLTVDGDGSHSSDYVYIDDVISGTILAWQKGDLGIYNIGSGRDVSIVRLATWTRYMIDTESEIVFNGKVDRPFRFYLGISKIEKLGYKPMNIEDGLGRYIQEITHA
jgi:UDP-glucose 4-epimerase